MRAIVSTWTALAVATCVLGPSVPAFARSDAERSVAGRAACTTAAVAANVLPGLSALYVPTCLPGYVLCKVLFAGASLVAAGEQLVLSAGRDREQTRAILYRGLAGDWYLTRRHTCDGEKAAPLPPAPPAPAGEGAAPPPG